MHIFANPNPISDDDAIQCLALATLRIEIFRDDAYSVLLGATYSCPRHYAATVAAICREGLTAHLATTEVPQPTMCGCVFSHYAGQVTR